MSDKLLAGLILTVYFSPVIYQGIVVLKETKKGNKLPLKRFFKVLRIAFSLLLFTTILILTLNHTNYLNYESPMTYDKIDEITFKNFKGIELFKKTLYGNERFAYVVVTIDYELNGNELILESHFHPSRSFVYNSHINDEYLLQHELYHFKITEVFTRKAKQKILKLKDFSKSKINSIIAETRVKESRFQDEYDYNTFHSYVMEEQKNYEKRIDSLLEALNNFKEPKILLNDKK